MRWLEFAAVMLAAGLLSVGCGSLPPGEPPAGRIGEMPDQAEVISPSSAANRMATMIAVGCPAIANARRPPSVVNEFNCTADPAFNALPTRLWWLLRDMGVVVDSPPDGLAPEYHLRSRMSSAPDGAGPCRWRVELIPAGDDGTPLWSGEIMVAR
jgi:hypothetical protein